MQAFLGFGDRMDRSTTDYKEVIGSILSPRFPFLKDERPDDTQVKIGVKQGEKQGEKHQKR